MQASLCPRPHCRQRDFSTRPIACPLAYSGHLLHRFKPWLQHRIPNIREILCVPLPCSWESHKINWSQKLRNVLKSKRFYIYVLRFKFWFCHSQSHLQGDYQKLGETLPARWFFKLTEWLRNCNFSFRIRQLVLFQKSIRLSEVLWR